MKDMGKVLMELGKAHAVAVLVALSIVTVISIAGSIALVVLLVVG